LPGTDSSRAWQLGAARQSRPMPTRILIADDHAFVRRGLRLFLEGSGHDCVVCGEAQDGVDAVQRAKELRPDVIILDLAMPKANGFEAAAQIAKELPGVPVLLHTLHNSPQLRIEAKKYGIRMVVPKEEGAGALVRALEPLIVPASNSSGTVDSLADTVVESRISAIESKTGTGEAGCAPEPIPKSN
jgi:DNA-binding NarL/FixJ family response regulator